MTIAIHPLRETDRAAWMPLWRGYQAFYEVTIPDAVSEVTWTRLLDPSEPMGGALAWDGATAVGLVHHIRHRSCWTIGDYCYLQDLYVDENARSLGVGRALIKHVAILARGGRLFARPLADQRDQHGGDASLRHGRRPLRLRPISHAVRTVVIHTGHRKEPPSFGVLTADRLLTDRRKSKNKPPREGEHG